VWPNAFGPLADLLLPISPGPAGPPGGLLIPHVNAVAELPFAPPPRRAAMAAASSPMHPLFMADCYHFLIMATIAI
jgi:hypothetical protein